MLWTLAILAILVAPLGGCVRPDARCKRLVDKIVQCDPTARGVPRTTLEAQCATSGRLHCADIDTGTTAGCGRFMGCLYDG